jgi:hypothetical protein
MSTDNIKKTHRASGILGTVLTTILYVGCDHLAIHVVNRPLHVLTVVDECYCDVTPTEIDTVKVDVGQESFAVPICEGYRAANSLPRTVE